MPLNISALSYSSPRITFKGSNQNDDYWLNLNLTDAFKNVSFTPSQVSIATLKEEHSQKALPEFYQSEDTFTSSYPGDATLHHPPGSERISSSISSNAPTTSSSNKTEKTPQEISKLFEGKVPTNAVFEEWLKAQKEVTANPLSSRADMQKNAELQKLKNKASMVKMVTTSFLAGATFASHWIPGVNIATAAIVIPVRSIMNMAIDFYYKPGNKIREKISAGARKLKTWFSSTFFNQSNSPRFAGDQDQGMSKANSQRSIAAQVVNNFMYGVSAALSKLEQAVTQNNPQAVLEAQKDVMKTTKTLVDQLGTEKDKNNATKAELAYKHYEQFVDGLDLTAPKLTYGVLSSDAKEHLHLALYYALTSQNNDLVQWARNYSRNLGITESFTQSIINNTST